MQNRLSRKTREAFEALMVEVYQEGYEAGKGSSASVEKESPLVAGDKVQFIGPLEDFGGDVTMGRVYTIDHVDEGGRLKFIDDERNASRRSTIRSVTRHLFRKIKTVKRAAEIGERILITNAVETGGNYDDGDIGTVARRGVYADSVHVKEWDRVVLEEEYEVIVDSEVEPQPDPQRNKTPNEQRAELLERASLHIRGLQNEDGYFTIPTKDGEDIEAFATFRVNAEMRTVTCILKARYINYTCKIKTSRCHPDDVFNARLGKLVSLCMCLGLTIPKEFAEAVQPDEVVKGMSIYSNHGYPIIYEDTNAIYGGDKMNKLPDVNEMYPQEETFFSICAKCGEDIMVGQDYIEAYDYDYCSTHCYIEQSKLDGTIKKSVAVRL